MNEYSADLHLHTCFSDGTFSPKELILKAAELNFNAVSVTDHDTVGGIPEAKKYADSKNIELIAGVEMTAEWYGKEIHVLGYYIEWQEVWFKDLMDKICAFRTERMKKMIKKFSDIDIHLNSGDVFSSGKNDSIGRLHLANVLRDKGIVSSCKEAFWKFIGEGKPCYVKKFVLSPQEAVNIILKAKGIPVIAHPGSNVSEKDILEFKTMGLMGIEVYHPSHSSSQKEFFRNLAEKNGMLITGGSDCHGHAKDKMYLGTVRIGKENIEALKSRKRELMNG